MLRTAMWHDRLTAAADLAGRVLLGFLFIHEAWSKLAALDAAAAYTEAYGLPAQLLPFAIALELGGGLLVALGFLTRLAALALAVFCVVAAVVFHSNFGDRGQAIHFLKDLALAGAFQPGFDQQEDRIGVCAGRPAVAD